MQYEILHKKNPAKKNQIESVQEYFKTDFPDKLIQILEVDAKV